MPLAAPTFAQSTAETFSLETWRATLEAGNSAKAWDEFIERYRRLILAVIRRTVSADDDVEEIFAEVCGDLSADDLHRVAQHTDSGRARFSTWLVTVVQRITIDWLRRRDGRRRVASPDNLSPVQQAIFNSIVRDRSSYVEAYEVLKQRHAIDISFPGFMKEVTATFAALRASGRSITHYLPGPPVPIEQTEPLPSEAVQSSDAAAKVAAALEKLEPEEQLAVQLFVVEELSAAQVAQILGWPNAKAVYNRVYRSLDVMQRDLKRAGVEP